VLYFKRRNKVTKKLFLSGDIGFISKGFRILCLEIKTEAGINSYSES
jgi:hypothetical protein